MKRSAFLLPALLIFAGCANTQHIDGGIINIDTPVAETAAMSRVSLRRAKNKSFSVRANAADAATGVADSVNFQAPAGRKMTYNTRLVINVPDTVKGVKKASSIAEKYSGYTAYSDNTTANVKVPVAKANAALKDFEAIGTVTAKTITANDITEHYTDTQVRLENLRRLQKRLSELLSRAGRVDEIIRIERELSRVTTDLERQQARMNVLNQQVELVDFQISFNAIVTPAQYFRNIIPLQWVRELGVAIRDEKFNATPRTGDSPVKFTPPAGFAIVEGTEKVFKAANPDNVVLKLAKFDNLPGADLDYYKNLIDRQLKSASFSNVKFNSSSTPAGVKYLTVTANYAGHTLAVMVAIYPDGWICKTDKVSVLEIYGPETAMKKIDFKSTFNSFNF